MQSWQSMGRLYTALVQGLEYGKRHLYEVYGFVHDMNIVKCCAEKGKKEQAKDLGGGIW